jgi:hypothetical protein
MVRFRRRTRWGADEGVATIIDGCAGRGGEGLACSIGVMLAAGAIVGFASASGSRPSPISEAQGGGFGKSGIREREVFERNHVDKEP